MIAQVRADCVTFLEASSDKLYLGPDYGRKAAAKHGLSPYHFNIIFDAVSSKTSHAVSCKAKHVSFLHLSAGEWFHVCVKVSGDTAKLYLVTFHRTDPTGVKSRLRRGKQIAN